MIFDATDDLSCLIHQLQHGRTLICCRLSPPEIQDISVEIRFVDYRLLKPLSKPAATTECPLPGMSIERLADVLIASRCGTHSLGLVYEFLLKAHGSPKQARADFVRFLSGELPPRLLKESQLWVSEEQGWETRTSIEDPMATEVAGVAIKKSDIGRDVPGVDPVAQVVPEEIRRGAGTKTL